MSEWKYRKQESSLIRGICVLCKKNPQKTKGGGKFKPLCSSCDKREFSPASMERRRKATQSLRNKKQRRPYLFIYTKGPLCEACGFIPEHSCQLDVDHIDGSKLNTAPDNFQTLCSNCHRLKTYKNGDWFTK